MFKAISACLQLVKDHHEEMFHDDYINYIAIRFAIFRARKTEILNNLKTKYPNGSEHQQAKEESQSKNTEKSQPNTGVRDTPSVLELNILSLLLHNRQTLEAAKILPNHLEPWLFPEGAIRNVYNALVNSKSLNQAIDQLKGTESELSIVSKLRTSKPTESPTAENAIKIAGELLIRNVENTYEICEEQ